MQILYSCYIGVPFHCGRRVVKEPFAHCPLKWLYLQLFFLVCVWFKNFERIFLLVKSRGFLSNTVFQILLHPFWNHCWSSQSDLFVNIHYFFSLNLTCSKSKNLCSQLLHFCSKLNYFALNRIHIPSHTKWDVKVVSFHFLTNRLLLDQ